jgi:hypothetical protein
MVETLRIHIMRKLWRGTYIGVRHMSIDDLRQGLPKHERDMSIITREVKILINEGYLLEPHPKRVSLNPKVLDKIKEMIEIRGIKE